MPRRMDSDPMMSINHAWGRDKVGLMLLAARNEKSKLSKCFSTDWIKIVVVLMMIEGVVVVDRWEVFVC